MAGIERCEARIRYIRNLNNPSPLGTSVDERVATTPDAHFHIGKSQNSPENVMMFLHKHSEDPAIKVSPSHLIVVTRGLPSEQQDFLPKLKGFLLPKIKDILSRENEIHSDHNLEPVSGFSLEEHVYIAGDRFYRHNLMRLNYTTYDVRRAQDIVNPSTSHCNIILLADHVGNVVDGVSLHPYIYACVLGIFHANVTYVGPGIADYRSRRIDFLWVRWYQYVEESAGWDASTLDRVCFPPMADDDAFGFVDPDDVLRGCHIIPQFSRGLRHSDGSGISRCADDSSDWHFYYINRFVIYFPTDFSHNNCI